MSVGVIAREGFSIWEGPASCYINGSFCLSSPGEGAGISVQRPPTLFTCPHTTVSPKGPTPPTRNEDHNLGVWGNINIKVTASEWRRSGSHSQDAEPSGLVSRPVIVLGTHELLRSASLAWTLPTTLWSPPNSASTICYEMQLTTNRMSLTECCIESPSIEKIKAHSGCAQNQSGPRLSF